MKYTLTLLVFLCSLGHALSVSAQTIECNEPNVLVLFDVSGSMKQTIGGQKKYDIAQNSLDWATYATDSQLRYGLMLFPEPGPAPVRCNTGTEPAVDFDTGNWGSMFLYTSPTFDDGTENPSYFGGPRGDFDTPMYQAIEAANNFAGMEDTGRRRYILLITDGVQDCCNSGDYDDEIDCDPSVNFTDPNYHIAAEYEENRQDLVNLVSQLKATGISTFVVGFGSKVDPQTLDLMATAGGTENQGCSPGTGDCYYQADDGTQLTNALLDIAQIVQVEVCDGIDNDCNGLIDENQALVCDSACGSGTQQCIDGAYASCSAQQPTVETCDGLDNDCDGRVDNGCTCVQGTTQSCGTQLGVCRQGTQTCVSGSWSACTGGTQAGTEVCDGNLDNDCDGLVDENCSCTNGETQACGSDAGPCEAGVQTCQNGVFGPCVGEVLPPLGEVCVDRPTDSDADGVPDDTENTNGTNPWDADSDDDGIRDGDDGYVDTDFDGIVDAVLDSDGDGNSNPNDPDSDNDGLNDGTERGITEPVADPDGPEGPISATDPDSPNFVPDQDPSTETDPTDADSDDDAVLDGDEDKNHNGALDPDETSANDVDSDDDGLQDGTELGYGPDDAHDHTDTSIFKPDADDGETVSDPTDADTDDGGVQDGDEDLNLNGRLDPGESDVLVGRDDGLIGASIQGSGCRNVGGMAWLLLAFLPMVALKRRRR